MDKKCSDCCRPEKNLIHTYVALAVGLLDFVVRFDSLFEQKNVDVRLGLNKYSIADFQKIHVFHYRIMY